MRGGGVFDMRLKAPREYRARPLAASHEANPMIQHHGFYSGPTQVAWACRVLLSGRTIGHDDEIAEAKGWRLAAIV